MQSLIDALTTLPDPVRVGLPLTFLAFGITLERVFPLKTIERPWAHVGTNLAMLAGVAAVSTLIALLTLGALDAEVWRVGLLHQLNLPMWVEFIIALLALDFSAQYLAHVLLHRYKWLWKLHIVHHSDRHVDASTGTRLHPLDFLLREVIAWAVVAALGIPIVYYAFYRLITPLFTYITHANVRVPEKIDRLLTLIIVTPNMHKVHHHDERPWTDRNFGNLFSVWDRLFGTYAYASPNEIRYGLDVLHERADPGAATLYVLPFDTTIKTDY